MNANIPPPAAPVAAAVPPPPVDPLRHCLAVCGLNHRQQQAFISEGFNMLENFSLMRPKHISDMVKRIVSLSAARGGVRLGQLQISKLEGLLYWTFDCRRRNLPMDYRQFTPAKVTLCIELITIDEEMEETDDTVKTPM